jgi:hypothetical protein
MCSSGRMYVLIRTYGSGVIVLRPHSSLEIEAGVAGIMGEVT